MRFVTKEADMEPLGRGLDAGRDTAFLVPGLGLVTGLREGAQGRFVSRALGMLGSHRRLRRASDRGGVAEQPEDKADVLLTPRYHFRTAVMAVGADRNLGQGPVPADAADEDDRAPPCPKASCLDATALPPVG
jgi:hypothetical protein